MTLADQPTPAPGQPAQRGRRADAERNRAAIIEAAGVVFAERGGTVDVREIARRSGVGMGTLYRHFPTKNDLLATVLEQEFSYWLTDAHRQAAATEDPWQALTGFFEQMLAKQGRNRALVESYAAAGGPTEACARHCYSVMDELLTRCLNAGLVRPDVTTADLVLLNTSLSQTVLTASDSHPGQWRRLLRISLDGLSSHNTEPLPKPATYAGPPTND
ncbi:TetR/AcrR family transcriptional regulator [Streptomyces sp. NPDC018352]|uniref:TetR/AcrR family transcriptional regulator n=1 Tax=Streptomyces sp. NPDC018352 TaxID=3157194 RepID=UPI0033C5F51B